MKKYLLRASLVFGALCFWTATASGVVFELTENGTPRTCQSVGDVTIGSDGKISAEVGPGCFGESDGGTDPGDPTYTLTVSKGGMGSGTVTSSPGTINCGSTCSASYTSGTSVTLTATAATGSTFGSWTNCPSVSGSTCTVSMTGGRTVTASFNSSGGGGTDAFGAGLWRPNAGDTSLVVADQSNADGEGTTSFVPGCLNFTPASYGAACRERTTFTGSEGGQQITFGLTQGQIISLRYRVNQAVSASQQQGSIWLSNIGGGSIVVQTTMSISTKPGDFDVPSTCRRTDTRTPGIATTASRCTIDTNEELYYLNIRVDGVCSGCVFIVNEDSNVLY